MTLLKVQNLSYSITKRKSLLEKPKKAVILSQISFELEEGKVLGVVGESGSGKTTLAKILAGIIAADRGEISFNFNTGALSSANKIQMLFQNTGEILNPLRVVEEIIFEALTIGSDEKIDLRSEAERIFDSLNIPHELFQHRGYELSGGEQQRIALARLLAVKPKILILDEPFSAQDPESQLNLIELFKKINRNLNITLICISHNLKVLKNLADEILVVFKGRIVERGEAGKIFKIPEHPYTKFLLNAENFDIKYEDFIKSMASINDNFSSS